MKYEMDNLSLVYRLVWYSLQARGLGLFCSLISKKYLLGEFVVYCVVLLFKITFLIFKIKRVEFVHEKMFLNVH